MSVTQRVFVSGRVQNIGYRDWVVRTARSFGITGWIRNRRDGRVELVAGDDGAAGAMIEALRGDSPPLARIDQVEAHADDERPPKGFTKRFAA